jgi:hypothetical protein
MGVKQPIDTDAYKQFGILLPGEGAQFETVGKTNGEKPRIIIEIGEDGVYHYTLTFLDEDGKYHRYWFTNVNPMLIDASEERLSDEVVYQKRLGIKRSIFHESTLHGHSIDDAEGVRVMSPLPEHEGRPITIMTCFTNMNHFGTKHLVQRIYFFVEGVKYPFGTIQLCCNYSM